MKVRLIAETSCGSLPSIYKEHETSSEETWTECLIEFAGRNCYQSWDRPNKETAMTRDYIRSIIKKGHLSVLEHASATLYIEDVSTAMLGQITRHRHLSFSVESARFADKNLFVEPEHYEQLKATTQMAMYSAVLKTQAAYRAVVEDMEDQGFTRRQARQEARFILPQGTGTKIVVTGNLRAWREFLQKRLGKGADVEIRTAAGMILNELYDIAPSVFEDLYVMVGNDLVQ